MKGLYIKRITEYVDKNYNNNKEDKEGVIIAAINEFIMYTQEGYSEKEAYTKTLSEISITSKETRYKFDKLINYFLLIVLAIVSCYGLANGNGLLTIVILGSAIIFITIILGFLFSFKKVLSSKYTLATFGSLVVIIFLSIISEDKTFSNIFILAVLSSILVNYSLFISKNSFDIIKSILLLACSLIFVNNGVILINNTGIEITSILLITGILITSIYEFLTEIDTNKNVYLKLFVLIVYFIIAALMYLFTVNYIAYQIVYLISFISLLMLFYTYYYNKELYTRTGYLNAVVAGTGFVAISQIIALASGSVLGKPLFYFGLLLIINTILIKIYKQSYEK